MPLAPFSPVVGITRVHAFLPFGRNRVTSATDPTIADCCLVPQVYSANRFKLDMSAWPAIAGVAERTAIHPAFAAAHPSRQPDAKT